MKRKYFGLLTLAALSWTALPSSANPATPPAAVVPASSWQPDADLFKQLTDRQTADTYTIALPKGGKARHMQVSAAKTTQSQYVWSFGSNLTLILIIAHPKDGETLPLVTDALDGFEQATVKTCDSASVTKDEPGIVSGMAVIRNRFTYLSPDSPHAKMAGFNYAAQAGNTLIIIGAFSPDGQDKSLSLGEAAALAFLQTVARSN
jgi:hypothetical protein